MIAAALFLVFRLRRCCLLPRLTDPHLARLLGHSELEVRIDGGSRPIRANLTERQARALFDGIEDRYTGLRFGELRDLRWADIDLDAGSNGVLHIRRGGSTDSTKTRRSRRVPMHPDVRRVIESTPRIDGSDRVFHEEPTPTHPEIDAPLRERRLLNQIKRLARDCGFPDWRNACIHSFILNNPVYCGKGLANARTSALYYRRSNGAPIDQSAQGRRPARKRWTEYRQPEDWVWIDEPRMADYLPADLRERALPRQRRYLNDRAEGVQRAPDRDKHVDSPFILKDVLTTPDGTRMTGQRNKHRYYIHSRSHTAPKSDEVRPRVRAEAVEHPILGYLRQMLLMVPHLREQILERSHE